MALTGLGLIGFIFVHLAGNLLLLKNDGSSFNAYAHTLESWGVLLYVAEVGLIGLFVSHIFSAILVRRANMQARPQGYKMVATKGGPSYASPASKGMAISGLLILVFLVIHIWQFKFGPNVDAGYVTESKFGPIRDLYRLVVESFRDPLVTGFYLVCLLALGLHLRHALWSAFQSLGLLNTESRTRLYAISLLVALILAGGFLLIPLWVFFGLSTMFTAAG